MTRESDVEAGYSVPRYRLDEEAAWYHVLHGTVPGHQIDFIYCPEVPQGSLTQTHFAHAARVITYIEPRDQSSLAFAIGNLSRDDVQHEPGHGGVALVFGHRVEGVVDHANRAMPPYAHGLLTVDRSLDYGVLIASLVSLHRRFVHQGADATGTFYREYVRHMREEPRAVEGLLKAYVADFEDLPRPGRSKLEWDFVAPEETRLELITIVHPNDEPFSTVASVAAALGSVLYRSNVKWTTISNSREIDIPGGISVRFAPESDIPRDPRGRVIGLDEVPGDDAEIAEKLFAARPRSTGTLRRTGWREQLSAKRLTLAAPPEEAPGAPSGATSALATSAMPVRDAVPDEDAPTLIASLDAASLLQVEVDDAADTLPAPLCGPPGAEEPARRGTVDNMHSDRGQGVEVAGSGGRRRRWLLFFGGLLVAAAAIAAIRGFEQTPTPVPGAAGRPETPPSLPASPAPQAAGGATPSGAGGPLSAPASSTTPAAPTATLVARPADTAAAEARPASSPAPGDGRARSKPAPAARKTGSKLDDPDL